MSLKASLDVCTYQESTTIPGLAYRSLNNTAINKAQVVKCHKIKGRGETKLRNGLTHNPLTWEIR